MKYETANIKALINRSVMISCIMITVNIGKINLALIFWNLLKDRSTFKKKMLIIWQITMQKGKSALMMDSSECLL